MGITVTLPTGARHEVEPGTTIVAALKAAGADLKGAIAARLDGTVVDLSRPLSSGGAIAAIAADSADGLDVLRHSSAHLMAQAVKRLFPETQITIGPVIEDGFFYDIKMETPFTPEDLERMQEGPAWRTDHVGCDLGQVVVVIGVALLGSTILYLIPQTAVLGAILLTGYLGGAVATHVRVGDPLLNILVPVIFGVVFIVFLLARIVPGDPCAAALGERANPRSCEAFNARIGLDKPIIPFLVKDGSDYSLTGDPSSIVNNQFVVYLGNLASGDLGTSVKHGRPVTTLLFERLPTTVGGLAEAAAQLSGPALLMVGEAMALAQAGEIADTVGARVSA